MAEKPGSGPVEGAGSPVRRRSTAIVIILSLVVVAIWEILLVRSRRPFRPFELRSEAFAGIRWQDPAWNVRSLPVAPDPVEPNILILVLTRASDDRVPVIVRLVHGYNLVDCMRIKGYTARLLADTRNDQSPVSRPPSPISSLPAYPAQIWEFSAPGGDQSLWVSSMLQSGDFSLTSVDTRDLEFPRVGIPDHPGWQPRGLSRESLRHPVLSLRLYLRSRWNSSRADLLTFLGLRQPAWASEELLTLVALQAMPAPGVSRAEVMTVVTGAHRYVYERLLAWRRQGPGPDSGTWGASGR